MNLQSTLERLIPESIEFNIGPIPVHILPGWMWLPVLRVHGYKIGPLYLPPVGLFNKRYKDVHNPRWWGGYFWMIDVGHSG